MTSCAAIIYISYLMSMFRGKTIGLIWDKHSSHYSAEVEEFVEKCNADKATDTRIVLELVDEGLTPIIQVPDVAVNKVFKAAVKEKYHAYRSGLQFAIEKKLAFPVRKWLNSFWKQLQKLTSKTMNHSSLGTRSKDVVQIRGAKKTACRHLKNT